MSNNASSSSDSASRYFSRDGSLNIERIGLKRKPFSDLYHSLLRVSWPRLLGLILILYGFTNAVFALLYMLDGGVENAHTFLDHYFFSVQTMMTIGYGTMSPRSVPSNVLVAVQALVGLIGLAMITGLFYGKFSLPTARVIFSRVAVITKRDGVPSLMFRLANERTNQVVEAELHVVFARDEVTLEGDRMRRFYTLDLVRNRNAIFALTWSAIHPITERSPLHGQTKETLKALHGEILVSVVGIDETSSVTIHARHSYSPDEIVWGGRFADIISVNGGRRQIDYGRFHDFEITEPDLTLGPVDGAQPATIPGTPS